MKKYFTKKRIFYEKTVEIFRNLGYNGYADSELRLNRHLFREI